MWQEFKEFAMKGDVLDLAVAVIIGGAFGKIVTSLVGDIIMPVIGLLLGGLDLSGLQIKIGQVVIRYGSFLQNVVDFLIIASVIFVMVKVIDRLHKKKEYVVPAPPTVSNEEVLLTEIRDLIKAGR